MTSEVQAGERHALVVDDNAHAAALAGAVLEAHGWTVDRAHDGFEAILRFRERSYDAVLLDYQLPGMNGAEVLGWMRRNVANLPNVVVLSSECPKFLAGRFNGLGVKAILTKPPAPAELWRALAA
jgi:CheY-like chemotaxis protein